jgi:hypothetical protein
MVSDAAGNSTDVVRMVTVVQATSFSGITVPDSGPGEMATVSVTGGGAGCGFSSGAFLGTIGLPAAPGAGPFEKGLVSFTLSGCTPGGSVNLNIDYASPVDPDASYAKYGPTAVNPVDHWYDIPATISGNSVSFSLTDGGPGDADLAANGEITDPGGPVVFAAAPFNAVPVPVDSRWALLLLILGLLMLARRGFAARQAREVTGIS